MMDGMRRVENFVDIGALEDIPRLGARSVKSPRGDIAVFRTADDIVYALQDRCPHKQGPLSQGIVHGNAVTCPLHGWVIGLTDGQALGLDKGCTPTFAVKVEHGRVLLALGGAAPGNLAQSAQL
jgi:nitrite reductase (NADH) small subunit